jgi:hypothetical protein
MVVFWANSDEGANYISRTCGRLAFPAAYVRTLSVPSEASVRVGIVRKAYAYAYYLTGAHLRTTIAVRSRAPNRQRTKVRKKQSYSRSWKPEVFALLGGACYFFKIIGRKSWDGRSAPKFLLPAGQPEPHHVQPHLKDQDPSLRAE